MNILFVTKSFCVGGLDAVTLTLAKTFKAHGHNVSIFAFYRIDDFYVKQLPDNIRIYWGNGYKQNHVNVSILRVLLKNNNVNVIINQWGLPFLPIRVINKAREGLNVKVISVYHNQVDTSGKLKAVEQAREKCHNAWVRKILSLKFRLFKLVTSTSMRYVYNNSDLYEVLSPSFIEIFKKFTKIKNPIKLVAQTNPITIDVPVIENKMNFLGGKNREILYVGRLDRVQKKVSRVIETWSYLECKYPDWKLTIVGDGDDRIYLEHLVEVLGLKNVNFEGYQLPMDYYKRASILMLTSDFEGFGLVIVEAMAYGVVPFVYGSYPAVFDIISDKEDGIILPKTRIGYDAEMMATKMASVMSSPSLLNNMAKNAIDKSKNFSLENIYNQWERLLNELTKSF